ncbi:MAG: hypothetical protein ACRDSR_23025 [Pseudonocardiaceae bacterium]
MIIKKQSGPIEREDPSPHEKHWWFLFEVEPEDKSAKKWMQVDLNLKNGYRIFWSESTGAPGTMEVKAVPEGLTSATIEGAVASIASWREWYSNPRVPDGENPRYSCQTFVEELASALSIAL